MLNSDKVIITELPTLKIAYCKLRTTGGGTERWDIRISCCGRLGRSVNPAVRFLFWESLRDKISSPRWRARNNHLSHPEIAFQINHFPTFPIPTEIKYFTIFPARYQFASIIESKKICVLATRVKNAKTAGAAISERRAKFLFSFKIN